MSYVEEIDAWLTSVLAGPLGDETESEWYGRAKKEIKAEILDSYHRGQKADLKPEKQKEEKKPEERRAKFWPRRGREER